MATKVTKPAKKSASKSAVLHAAKSSSPTPAVKPRNVSSITPARTEADEIAEVQRVAQQAKQNSPLAQSLPGPVSLPNPVDGVIVEDFLPEDNAPMTVPTPSIPAAPEIVGKAVAQKALVVSTEAKRIALAITDIDTERAAVSFRTDVIKPGIEEANKAFDPIVETAKLAYDTAREQRSKSLEPFQLADRLILDAITSYRLNLQRIQREEQQRAEREQAERERLASIERDRERTRLQAEIDAKLEELPADAPDELIAKIMAPLEEIQAPMAIAPPVQVSVPETASGMTLVDNWRAITVDAMEVLRQVVKGDLPMGIVELKQSELNRLAKLYKDERKIPGLRFENAKFTRGTGR